MGKYIQVFTTTEKKKDAEKIAGVLLENRLAGCVQIMPVDSRYRWKGAIEKGREYLCIIKSRKALYKQIEKTIKKYHPYKVPEIISVPVPAGSRDYLKWLEDETGRKQRV